MPRNFGFTKTPPRASADLGRMAQAWGDYHARPTTRDRAYRRAAIALIAIVAGMLLAMIASNAWAQAQADAAHAAHIMRF